MKVAWFSCGITSAMACILKPNYEWIYLDIETSHPDNDRFIKDVELKFDKKITRNSNPKFKSQFEVIRKTKFINSPNGASCTRLLKREVREFIEKNNNVTHQVFGFTVEEIDRAERFQLMYPEYQFEYPLIDLGYTKSDCKNIFLKYGIALPKMYELGYSNNNCIGCVKGGKKYWRKIKRDFPTYFNEMALLERQIGRSCINGTFLDELDEGQIELFVTIPECNGFCSPD